MLIFVLKDNKTGNLYYSLEYRDKTFIFVKETKEIHKVLDLDIDISGEYGVVDYMINNFSLEDEILNEILEYYR